MWLQKFKCLLLNIFGINKTTMKLIIGLGNPWTRYKNTRHNAWFIFLDKLREEHNFEPWKFESKFKAEISEWRYNWKKTFLLKPQTFMNLSGESIQKFCNFYKIQEEDWIVVYDDKDMDFAKVRFRDKGSTWWHNWIKSIIQYFWQEFKRIKIWIWYDSNYEVSDWVLGKFIEQELIDLDNEVYENVGRLLEENL